ncbi:uncharacterized protein [Palaemon carinicauda]|uniref:uncharacterized protein isoform X3 n=1 Tax=Palaemon carinicauda TaxID=392227 RepID=UPI0035B628F2
MPEEIKEEKEDHLYEVEAGRSGSNMAEVQQELVTFDKELAELLRKYEEEEYVARYKARKEEIECDRLCNEIVERTLNLHQKVKLSNPTAIFAEKTRNKELLQLELRQKSLMCEITLLKENNNLEYLEAEKQLLLEEISELESSRSQIEPIPEDFTSAEDIEKEINSSKAGVQSSQNRTYSQFQPPSFERVHASGNLKQVLQHWKTFPTPAKVFEAEQRFAKKPEEEEERRGFTRVDNRRPYASGGGGLSTPRTFKRNPAPPTPKEVIDSGIPLHKLGGFIGMNRNESSDDSDSDSVTAMEEAEEEVTREHSSGRGPSRVMHSFSATQHNASSRSVDCNRERSTNQFMGRHHSSLAKEITVLKRTLVVCKETEVSPSKLPKVDRNAECYY